MSDPDDAGRIDPSSLSQCSRKRTWPVVAVVLVVLSCFAIQGSAAVATTLFDDMSPISVATWRQLIGAATLVLIFRPRLRGRSRGRWALIVLLGIAMAAMNTSYYLAVERIPLGIAAALFYLGPFLVAVASLRRARLLVWPAIALVGVIAITRPDQGSVESIVGILLALLAAASLAGYTILSHLLGRSAQAGLGDLSLSVCVSAVVLLPTLVVGNAPANGSQIGTLILLGALGVALPFACDYQALRFGGPALVGTLFALDPVAGAVVGLIALGQVLTMSAILGLIAICLAGAGLTIGTAMGERRHELRQPQRHQRLGPTGTP
ncbi:EamA family transporter [Brevibacterium sp. RIT 803]|uniref:EamA family transporter n=1 Tax=Brevibacterium sp. RIT 803 TaxID=2810210 RepID=UPI0019501E11|nr:EamA family transporter [Brevibacterium sp. RIT 803]MBM6590929.1 EamA family transporter [Brevibacterium sp. RIT 803]